MSQIQTVSLDQVLANIADVTYGTSDKRGNMMYTPLLFQGNPFNVQLFTNLNDKAQTPFGYSQFEDGGLSVQISLTSDMYDKMIRLQNRFAQVLTEHANENKMNNVTPFLQWFKESNNYPHLLRIKLGNKHPNNTEIRLVTSQTDTGVKLKDATFECITKSSYVIPVLNFSQMWSRSKDNAWDSGVSIRASALMVWNSGPDKVDEQNLFTGFDIMQE